jgi:hypothetical protein
MKITKTKRGFKKGEFLDFNGVKCSIQMSSIATDDCIWFGAKEIGLQEFVAFRKPSAWKDVELKESEGHHYIANNRMHLSRKQVKKLIPILQKFVDTRSL